MMGKMPIIGCICCHVQGIIKDCNLPLSLNPPYFIEIMIILHIFIRLASLGGGPPH